MGKDRSGQFHLGKGKPSGVNKEAGLGIGPTEPEKMDEYLEISDKYTEDEKTITPGVHVRHPNRNTSKGEDTYKAKENNKETDKTVQEPFTNDVPVPQRQEINGQLTRDIFAEIANYKSSCCISIYLDTHEAGVEVNERFDTVALKNALQHVQRVLADKQVLATTIEKMLKPGYDLLRDDAFWLTLTNGLAIFIAEDYCKLVKMPVAPVQDIVVESSFYITPLVDILANPDYFYLLVISKQNAKLFKGDKFGLQFLPIDNLPESMDEVTGTAQRNASTFRTGGRGGTGGANFHGIGGGLDHKTDIASYLEAVDDVLFKQIFNKENAPLLIAGVDYLLPIYRSVCDYHNLYPEVLTGSYEHTDSNTLHKDAMKVMQPFFEKRKSRALEQFANNIAQPLTASMPDSVVPAAYYGRVASLFVRKGDHMWGKFDEMNNQLHLHEREQVDSEDLVDNAVEKTLMTGGEVFLLDRDEMPSDGPVAAVFRY